jgi:hypothetical protein
MDEVIIPGHDGYLLFCVLTTLSASKEPVDLAVYTEAGLTCLSSLVI